MSSTSCAAFKLRFEIIAKYCHKATRDGNVVASLIRGENWFSQKRDKSVKILRWHSTSKKLFWWVWELFLRFHPFVCWSIHFKVMKLMRMKELKKLQNHGRYPFNILWILSKKKKRSEIFCAMLKMSDDDDKVSWTGSAENENWRMELDKADSWDDARVSSKLIFL